MVHFKYAIVKSFRIVISHRSVRSFIGYILTSRIGPMSKVMFYPSTFIYTIKIKISIELFSYDHESKTLKKIASLVIITNALFLKKNKNKNKSITEIIPYH